MSGEPSALDILLRCLDLDALDRDLYLGDPGPGEGRLFGGMVAAQSVIAAYRTLDGTERPLHSLHAYFLRPGRHDLPLRFVVDRIRDGRSFTTRNVVAHQGGEAIFNLAASFARPEPGISHQDAPPPAPPPEELEDWDELRARTLGLPSPDRESAVEVRLGDPYDFEDAKKRYEPKQRNWIRVRGNLPDDPTIHTAVLTYLTDRTLLSTAARAHGLPWGRRMAASLDHAIWIHRPVRLDERWLLYAAESPADHAARGLIFGGLYDADGQRIASVAQEALIREKRPD
ncbi:MAG: acyl-CoA thioesterase domain-containing protein [Myxococcota bacterium]